MSQGTPINKLNGNSMNDEDSRLVDSILNDLNSGSDSGDMQGGMPPGSMPQAGGPPQQMSPEQHKAMLAQRQQQMMQQQMMMQQQQQAMMQQQQQTEKKDETESILEKIQSEWKTVLIVFVLAVCVNMGAVDNVLKTDTLGVFVDESGNLTIQSVFMKAIAVAISFFLINTFVPL
mgnify:CR=1 FL=1